MAKFFETIAGKLNVGVVVLMLTALAVYSFLTNTGSVVEDANTRMFMDAETGKTFPHELKVGETMPVMSPYSNKKTGYETERCYWTKNGTAKEQPTYVLLNSTLGKAGPTFCPDCGRLVVSHNAPAKGAVRPPPLQSEFKESDRESR